MRYLVRNAESNSRVPFKELKNLTNIDMSIRTIQRQLWEEGIHKWRAVKRPLLTQKHAKEHLKWAKAHRYWTVDDWNVSFGLMNLQYRKTAMLRDIGFFDIKIRAKNMPHRMYDPKQEMGTFHR